MSFADPTTNPRIERRRLPVNIVPEDEHLFANSLVKNLGSLSVEEFTEAEFFSQSLIRTRSGEYVAESFVDSRHFQRWIRKHGRLRAWVQSLVVPPKHLDAPAICVTDNWSHAYFHWFADSMPRLEFAQRYKDLSGYTLLLPHKFKNCAWLRDSLKSYELRDVRVLRRVERIRCRSLLLPSHVALTANFDSAIMQQLRVRLRRELANRNNGPVFDRIYISRRKAARRRIANEEALLPVLRRNGFEVVVAESLTWRRQCELSAAAKVMVSNHGAGLTNMLLMSSGASVVEIRQEGDAMRNCFFNLANALGLEYYYLLARQENPGDKDHDAHVVVDVDRFAQVLSDVLDRRSEMAA